MTKRPLKLLYFVTEDWFFCSHFIERAVAARNAGYEVTVLTNVNQHGELIINSGLNLIPTKLDRRSLNPLTNFFTLSHVLHVYKSVKPDIVHQIALKPILLGSIAARILGISKVVNAVVGMGYIFSSDKLLARTLRPLLSYFLKLLNIFLLLGRLTGKLYGMS